MNSQRRSRPPLANLETVCLVARHGSFTAAAEASGLTHGAISRRVGAVENWLGCPLFERHGRGVSLTCDGQRFLGRVEHAFDVIDAAADQWHQARKTPAVRLSVVPSFAKLWLLERLRSLEAGEPFIDIQVTTEHRNADVGAGEVDIALRYGRGGWTSIDAEPLMSETLYPVASPEVAARLAGADVAQMLAMPLLHDSDLTGWRAWCGAQGASLIQSQYSMFQEILKASVRKVSLTVKWTVLGSENSMKVVAYFTDASAMDKVLNGLGSQELQQGSNTDPNNTNTPPPNKNGSNGK